MKAMELSPGCRHWAGAPTMHPPQDRFLLQAVEQAGYFAFTGPGGLCGGKSENRTVLAIHRGGGTKWEIVFRENDADVVTTTSTDLQSMVATLVAWLRGGSLAADENSLHAVAQ